MGILISVLSIAVASYLLLRYRMRSMHVDASKDVRDINRIFVAIANIFQILITIPIHIPVEWPDNARSYLSAFDGFVNLDLVSMTGASCEQPVNFPTRFSIMAAVPVLIVMIAIFSYFHGRALIQKRVEWAKTHPDPTKHRTQVRVTFLEIFDMIDKDDTGRLEPNDMIDLLQLLGAYCEVMDNMSVHLAERLIQRVSGSMHQHSLSRQVYLSAMEDGSMIEKLELLLGDHHRKKHDGRKRMVHGEVDYLLRWNRNRKLVSRSWSWALHFLVLMHTPVSRKVFEYLSCDVIGGSEHAWSRSYLRADYSIPCDDSFYFSFRNTVVTPVMLFFTIGLPGCLAVHLFWNRRKLYHPSIFGRVGWLYDRMTKGAEAWELFEMLVKMVLTGAIVFFPESTSLRSCVALTVCVLALCALNYSHPFRNRFIFFVTETGYGLVASIYLVGVVLGGGGVNSTEARDGLGSFIIITSGLFILGSLFAVLASLVIMRRHLVDHRDDLDETKRRRSTKVVSEPGTKSGLRLKMKNRERLIHAVHHAVHLEKGLQNFAAHGKTSDALKRRRKKVKLASSARLERRLSKRKGLTVIPSTNVDASATVPTSPAGMEVIEQQQIRTWRASKTGKTTVMPVTAILKKKNPAMPSANLQASAAAPTPPTGLKAVKPEGGDNLGAHKPGAMTVTPVIATTRKNLEEASPKNPSLLDFETLAADPDPN